MLYWRLFTKIIVVYKNHFPGYEANPIAVVVASFGGTILLTTILLVSFFERKFLRSKCRLTDLDGSQEHGYINNIVTEPPTQVTPTHVPPTPVLPTHAPPTRVPPPQQPSKRYSELPTEDVYDNNELCQLEDRLEEPEYADNII